ncbi:MAG: redoxin domain-containing protein [Dehalococcoidia bacterium]|nr:redoxin domain-containing protein [Dehalococcoidia bacterium]
MTKVGLALGLVFAAALVGLLAWALVQSGGQPRQALVNSRFGEAPLQPREAPAFTLNLLDGETRAADNLKGKLVMVDFWASWCPPCRQEAPVLARVYQEYRSRGVEFVGIAVWDDEGQARRYVQRYEIAYPNGLDERGIIAIDYGVTGIPEKYFITPEGQVVRKFIGPMDEDRLRQVLEELLASSSALPAAAGPAPE